MQRRESEPSVAGAFVVLPHRQRRTPQRLGLLPLRGPALELLGQVWRDHLEDPTTQDPQRLRVMVGSQLHQVCLRGRALLGRDSELPGPREPLQRPDDRAALREVDPARGHRCGEDLVLLDLLREPEVGAGLAAYLPGLGRDPVRRGAGTGLDRGLRRSASASRRRASASSWARPCARVTRAARLSSGRMDISGASARESRRETSRWAKSSTGWRCSIGWLLMSEFKHRALTEKGL